MSLPLSILRTRMGNEISSCARQLRHGIEVGTEDLSEFPVEIGVSMVKVPALFREEGELRRRWDHLFHMIVDKEYPFEKPLVVWKTPIFHPNIMMPEDGGHVCIKLLDDWSFNSTLLSFIKGIEALLLNPNPTSPFGTESCTRAAEYFNAGRRTPPVVCSPPPKVVREY
ncbi:MAG: ubiquitin-conjugating enzyme E2 [Methanomassiliicoccales archaeon]